MRFAIDFNRENDDKTLEAIGAKRFYYEEYSEMEIDVNLEDIENMLKKVNEIKKYKMHRYLAILSFNPPTIYLDNQI